MSDVTKVPLPGLLREHANVIPNALTNAKGTSYDLKLWRNAFAGNPSVTRDLNVIGKKYLSPIRRRDIQALAREACNGDDAETRRLFLASMIWGWGNRGRGLKHTATSLADPALAKVLKHTVSRVRSGNITAAYNGFSLKGCGPAFFTKFFYFIGLGCNVKPLPVILDTRVAQCLESICNQEGWDFSEFASVGRNSKGRITHVKPYAKGYVKYVDAMDEWATQLGCSADNIEYLMYRWRTDHRGGQMNSHKRLEVPLPAERMGQLEAVARQHYGEKPETVAKIWIIDRLNQLFGGQDSAALSTQGTPSGPDTAAPTEREESASDMTLHAVKEQLAEKHITDPHERCLFLQTSRFKQWANYIAGLVLAKKGNEPFTSKDIKAILRDRLLVEHYGKEGASEGAVLTPDVRIDAPKDSPHGFPSLEQVGRGLYRFVGFKAAIGKRYGQERLSELLSECKED